MWHEKDLVPHVLKYLSTRDGYEATTRDIKDYLKERLTLDDDDLSYTSSSKVGTKTNRFEKTVGNLISHRRFENLDLGRYKDGRIKLHNSVGYVARIMSSAV